MKERSLEHAGNILTDRSEQPRVWLLTGYRAGDNAQVIALAEALGWPFETRHFVYRRYEFITNRLLGPTLAGIDPTRSESLLPPWPDLVITAGRRNEPIARWIKAQSGNRTRLIHLGRSWTEPDHFDLIITTPQYQVPAHAKVLEIDAPLHRVTAARLDEAAARWQSALADLPRPVIAALLGGDSPPYVFDARMAGRLGRKVIDLARRRQGSVVVATSPRTSTIATSALEGILTEAADVPSRVYRWTSDATSNPYVGYLALADILVVTGDSMSMVAEACATGKPVQIFDMGEGWTRMRAADGSSGISPDEPDSLSLSQHLKPKRLVHWMLAHWLPRRIRRDIRDILRPLVAHGRATWLGDEPQPPAALASADLPRAVARARALFTRPDDNV
jgi:hypothetical protein